MRIGCATRYVTRAFAGASAFPADLASTCTKAIGTATIIGTIMDPESASKSTDVSCVEWKERRQLS